ncbi:hypothetical protein GW17_00027569 [Ensete ventricosum]|nr:hypothetical protein GW17_00027569 [Ensete ventricosum]
MSVSYRTGTYHPYRTGTYHLYRAVQNEMGNLDITHIDPLLNRYIPPIPSGIPRYDEPCRPIWAVHTGLLIHPTIPVADEAMKETASFVALVVASPLPPGSGSSGEGSVRLGSRKGSASRFA